MRTLFLFKTILLSVLLFASCNKNIELTTIPESNQEELPISGEEKAIETFNKFIENLNANPKTRSTIVPTAKVISVKKTTASAYGRNPPTRSGSKELSIYELTLENPDNTSGFAVVTDAATIDEVVAYVPEGAIADTVFNKSLALYFRDLSLLSEAINERVTTKADYWQPGWDEIFNVQIRSREFVRWLTDWERANRPMQGRSWTYYDPVDKMEIISAYVPTKWGQTNPYNNRVPVKYIDDNPKKDNVMVGCYPVAVGQVMAYHRYPASYNWSMLTMSPMVAPTPYKRRLGTYLGINLDKETAAQKEVSRLLYDIALAGETKHDPKRNAGSTYLAMVVTGLNRMGYSANEIYMGAQGGSSLIIRDEIKNFRRPVLYAAQNDSVGHIWVIDAVLTQERWGYISSWYFGGENDGKEGLDRYRVQGNLVHCNWGWHGSGDGWFYNFTPPYKDGFIKLYKSKYLYTGIKPM